MLLSNIGVHLVLLLQLQADDLDPKESKPKLDDDAIASPSSSSASSSRFLAMVMSLIIDDV